jgi:hypothetical protein
MGRWVRPPEILGINYEWNPRRQMELKPSGEYSALAFWMAMELADPEVRDADLELMARLATDEVQALGYGDKHVMRGERLWPYILESEEAIALIIRFHDWAERLGRNRAIELVAHTLRDGRAETVDQLIQALELATGIQFRE